MLVIVTSFEVIGESYRHAQQIEDCLDGSVGDHSDIHGGDGEVHGDHLAGELLDSSNPTCT